MSDWKYDNYQDWELHPTVRTSTELFTKWQPVNVTLDAAGTAKDLFVVEQGLPTVNIVPNPSFENGIAEIDNDSGVTVGISQSSSLARSGSNSLRFALSGGSNTSGNGVYYEIPESIGHGGAADPNTRYYMVVSAYIQTEATDKYRIEVKDTNGTTLGTSPSVGTSGSWERAHVAIPLTPDAKQYRIYFILDTLTTGTGVNVDDFQIELHRGDSNPTPYCDGSLGVYHEWAGEAHNSISRRREHLVSIRGFELYTDLDVYVALDNVASSTTGFYIPANSSWNMTYHPIYVRDKISFVNVNASETPTVRGMIWGSSVLKQD